MVRYVAFESRAGPDPRKSTPAQVAAGLYLIIDIEGPIVAKRAYDLYLRGSDIHRMGSEIEKLMNRALQHAIQSGQIIKEDKPGQGGLVYSTVRTTGASPVVLRARGPRDFDEIPPSELQLVARHLSRDERFESGSDAHLRAVLEYFDLKRLTAQVGNRLLDVLNLSYSYVDELFGGDGS